MKRGRKKIYDTARKLKMGVDAYFDSISYEMDTGVTNVRGKRIIHMEFAVPPSVEDLCIFLDIDDRTWRNYKEDEELKPVCEYAKLRIRAWLIEQLNIRKQTAGIQFNLENNYNYGKNFNLEMGEATREVITMQQRKEILAQIAAGVADDGILEDDGEAEADNGDTEENH